MLLRTVRAIRLAEPAADPFREHRRRTRRANAQLLGGRFRFECDEPALMKIVHAACTRLPAHRFATPSPDLLVRLVLVAASGQAGRVPPPLITIAGGGMLCGVMGRSFAVITPQRRAALVVISRDMLRFPYHLRYELLEFAVYTLAARTQGLVPLHAACVGLGGAGVLLIGSSGSGKSTVTLHSALARLDFLAEDSVMVEPRQMLASGIASFLHIRRDSLQFLAREQGAARIRRSPLIRRRSGVRKLEIDARRCGWRLARAPLRIAAIVFVERRPAGERPLLATLRPVELVRRLTSSQRYAARQPGWSKFIEQARQLPAYELRRGKHPREAAAALRSLLREHT